MSSIRVTESRRYDAHYDPTYTGPFTANNMQSDPRVLALSSSDKLVSGQTRYKFFRRPVMPRMNAVPPYVLLAPVAAVDPLKPVDFVPEPTVKDVEVQTMFRESEAQTMPYSPDFVIPAGGQPEVLLLKNLTYENGLPLGKQELEMILHARIKKEIENNLPPFTDEASVLLRKRLMEAQDTREFKLRENEIDAKREMRLMELSRALYERDEANEFMASQRIEAMRQIRMEEREKALLKIRNKRIKVLRRLARQRNSSDPSLVTTGKRDIISDYFDRSSQAYAPLKREGKDAKIDTTQFEVLSRTAPLDNITNITDIDPFVPPSLLGTSKAAMSRTAPGKSRGGRAAEERLTSAAARNVRNTKRDVEEMHQILLNKKRAAVLAKVSERNAFSAAPAATAGTGEGSVYGGSVGSGSDQGSLLAKKPKGRPPTPDLTVDANGDPIPDTSNTTAAVVMLQKLIRGRAVQNIMYEGRYRRRELIAELRSADEYLHKHPESGEQYEKELARKRWREKHLRETTIDTMAGTVTSHLFLNMANHQVSHSFSVIDKLLVVILFCCIRIVSTWLHKWKNSRQFILKKDGNWKQRKRDAEREKVLPWYHRPKRSENATITTVALQRQKMTSNAKWIPAYLLCSQFVSNQLATFVSYCSSWICAFCM
jgi:hypothetical protein